MKKVIAACLVGLWVLVSGAAAGLAGSSQAKAPVLEKLIFVHYAANAKPTPDASSTSYKLLSGGVKWNGTIAYEVNPANSGISTATVLGTLGAGSETWDAATAFDLFATPTETTQTAIGLDGVNRVVWADLSLGTIGVTYLWYNPAAKEIVESDTAFNTDYPWSATGAPDAMDLQNIATHEFGHNGLSDLRSPRDSFLTMYGYSGLGETIKQTLGVGDILGIQRLYD